MKLHAIQHDLKTTLWCGPAALSAVTGKSTSHVHEAIRQSMNPAYRHKPIKGVSNTILVRAAELLGCEVIAHFSFVNELRLNYGRIGFNPKPPTLAKFCRDHRELLRSEILIINITGHYVTVSGRSFIDNHTGKVVLLSSAPFRRARVQAAWIIRPGMKLDKVAPPMPKPADPHAKARRESQALAKQYGILLEQHNPGEYWVYPPDGLETEKLDPYYNEHLAYDGWSDVHKRVTTYVKLAKVMEKFCACTISTPDFAAEVERIKEAA